MKNRVIADRDQFASTSGVLGFHGTSIEAISDLAKTKLFPESGICPGRLCMVRPDCDITLPYWYAQQIAVRHYLLRVLPFRVPSHFHVLSVQSLVDDKLITFRLGAYQKYFREFMRLASEADMTEDDVTQIVQQGYEIRNGCLIALSSRMREDFQIVLDDAKIELMLDPQKDHTKYVSAICPLGSYEQEALRHLSL